MARGRTAPVKAFVLDQKRIAGVGNIYADEALFRAGIHPLRAAGSLKRPQLEALREAIEHALRAGIDAKGATIDDFRHVDGAYGSFQDRFLVHLREGEPCVRCGTHDPQARRRRTRDLRLRALPAAPAPRRRARRPARAAAAQAASSSGSLPERSAASSSWKPPSVSPSITIWGKVIMPVFSESSARPSGSLARLISVYSILRLDSSALALEQKGHASVVYMVTGFIASENIAQRIGGLQRCPAR